MADMLNVVIGLVLAAVAPFVIRFLNKRSAVAHAELDAIEADSVNAELRGREAIAAEAKAYALDAAQAIAEKNFPKLARKVQNGDIKDVNDVKEELYSWGDTLKAELVKYFEDRGVDIVKALGDKYIDRLIEVAANRVSPFPGKETATMLLKDKVADMIVDKGIYAIKHALDFDKGE